MRGPWGPGHMPRPTRAPPLPAFSPEPPRFIKEPKDQIGVSGGVASFVCQATGDPKPRVTWNKKGKKVNSQRFEVSWGDGGGETAQAQPHPLDRATEAGLKTFPRRRMGSQGWASHLSGPLPLLHPPCPLHEGPARFSCSATLVLCGLKQRPALSESYLTPSHRRESPTLCTFPYPAHLCMPATHFRVHVTHPLTHSTLCLCRPSFLPPLH